MGRRTSVSLLALCLLAAMTSADNLIPRHGEYSRAYRSSWTDMPTGRELVNPELASAQLLPVRGEDERRVFRDEQSVRLSGKRLAVSWDEPGCDKYRHALYLFQDCEEVIIDDLSILNADPDFRASSTLFFEGCGRVEIRNSRFAGTSGRAMIRLEGCEEYFIDRVEIAGHEYPGVGVKSGPGIFINNGAGWDAEKNMPGDIYGARFRELKWGVIQNCYIHDHPNLEPETNHDGILFHAPADGLIFNCVFENYEGDSCLDISHRRNDPAYRNHHFRIERCVFDRCHRVKTNGAVGSADCSILWCNNLYLDSMLTDYHVGWPNRHAHESFIFTTAGGYFLTMNCRGGATILRNCLLYSPAGRNSMYEPWGTEGEEDTWIRPDHFAYFMPDPSTWIKPRKPLGRTIEFWADWQAAGFDAHSFLSQSDPGFMNLPPGGLSRNPADYRLRPGSPAAGVGVALQDFGPLAVSTDFLGHPRPPRPSCGAFEVAE